MGINAKEIVVTALLTAIALLSGCASVVSPDALKEVRGDVTPAMVQSDAAGKYVNQKVVWGGIILNVENLEKTTVIEVFATRLDSTHTPTNEARDPGIRFLAEASGYLDAFIYRPNKMITVAGIVKGVETKNIGKTGYPYPVVTAVEMHLFDLNPEPEYQPLPWPPAYYDPYWPYYWPYYPPYYPWRGPYPPR
ncbi:MAG: Slp family lipoprotein [Deltaproteobacteria bacterium]|nr:Slp family lipoprotein [Deltaproteobacteria bacterium]